MSFVSTRLSAPNLDRYNTDDDFVPNGCSPIPLRFIAAFAPQLRRIHEPSEHRPNRRCVDPAQLRGATARALEVFLPWPRSDDDGCSPIPLRFIAASTPALRTIHVLQEHHPNIRCVDPAQLRGTTARPLEVFLSCGR